MLVCEGMCLMTLTQDQEPKTLIEELQEEGFARGDVAKGELNEVLIENGVPLFFKSLNISYKSKEVAPVSLKSV